MLVEDFGYTYESALSRIVVQEAAHPGTGLIGGRITLVYSLPVVECLRRMLFMSTAGNMEPVSAEVVKWLVSSREEARAAYSLLGRNSGKEAIASLAHA